MRAQMISRRAVLKGAGAAVGAFVSAPLGAWAATAPYVSQMERFRQDGISPEDEDHDLNILNGDDAGPAWRSMVANGMGDGIRKFKGKASGLYRINSRDGEESHGVLFPGDRDDRIEIDLQTSRVMGRISEEGNYFTLYFDRRGGSPSLHVHSGVIDLSEGYKARPGKNNRPGLNGIGVSQAWNIHIHNIEFDHGFSDARGASIGEGQGDSGVVFGTPRSGTIRDCRFIGAPDNGIYANGNNEPDNYVESPIEISGNHFYRCGNALSFKRFGRDWRASGNTMIECANGISIQMGGGPCIIDGNTMIRTQIQPIQLTGSDGSIVNGNRFVDWGRWISDGTTYAGANGNEAMALFVHTTSNVQVDDNVFEMRAWSPSTEERNEHVAIRVSQRGGADGPVVSTGNSGRSNTAINVARAIHYGPGVEGNDIRFDGKIGVVFADDLDDGALNGIVPFDPLTVLADAPPISLDVPLPGALATDQIAVWYTQNAYGCRFWGEVTAPGSVRVWIENATEADVELAAATLLIQRN